jgi:hypothetical protein
MVSCCGTCGKVLDQEIYTDEPNFVKDNTGQVDLVIMLLNTHFLSLAVYVWLIFLDVYRAGWLETFSAASRVEVPYPTKEL